MARGWESKDVESRQEQFERQRESSKHATETPEQQRKRQHHDVMLLERIRLQRELRSARNPRFRGQLEKALAFVENELKKFESADA